MKNNLIFEERVYRFLWKRHLILALCFLTVSSLPVLATNILGDSQIEKQSMTNEPGQTIKVTGKVVDETDLPMPGVIILVEGSTRGVSTDLDGTFEIEVSTGEKLKCTFLGYQEQIITVEGKTSFLIKMEPKVDELDEVTVVAFGKQKKESVIGAITTVSVANLKGPVGKISSNLAGQMAGMVAVQRSGEPGAGAEFWIRGISSFGANNSPLILVDGIERPIDLVDTEDIESFSILKDATATAVYGVRGANGIVLITTKRGQEGKFVINAKLEAGILSPIRMPKLANAGQWIDYYNDISYDSTGRYAFSAEDKERYMSGYDPDLYPNVDWMDEIFKSVTTNQRVNLNVSGGSKRIRYYVAGSFYTENGIYNSVKNTEYSPSMRYSKFNFRSNIDMDVTSTTVVSLNLSTQYESKNKPGVDDMWTYTLRTTPIATPTIFSDGTIASPPLNPNPWNMLNQTGYISESWNNSQSLVSVTQDLSGFVTKGLTMNAKFSWDVVNSSSLQRTKSPSTFYAIGRDDDGNLIYKPNSQGSDFLALNDRWNAGSKTMNFEASLVYNNIFAEKHRVGGLFLFNMKEHTNNFPENYIASFPNKNQGIAARATYSFMDTYFIEGNFGYNGSENFAPKKRFGFFPSIAVGYLISNEKFFEPLSSVVSMLKFKGSHGKIGNDQIGGNRRFAYNSEMMYSGGYNFGSMSAHWTNGIATGQYGNVDMSWETAKKTNIGIEFELFNKLKVQTDYFREKREGIYIVQRSIPSVVGANVDQYVNLGRMLNRGIDGSVEYNQTINDFYIQGRANFTFNRNKKLYDDKPTPTWAYLEEAGFANEQQMGLIALGLFESEEEIRNSPTQSFGPVRPGDIKYRDINGDGVVDDNDRVAIGHSSIPEVNYGFGTSIAWKGIDVSLFFQGTARATRFISGGPIYGYSSNILYQGQIYSEVADQRWTLRNPDPNAKYPRMIMGSSSNNQRSSTFYQRDMSFLRLKNVELGYTLAPSVTKKVGISKVRFYLQGVNLLTFSKFKLWDPELSTVTGNVYPQMKTISLGTNLIF